MALDPADVENLLAAISPGGIEAQEARGQIQFVASETLPKDCPKDDLELLGIKFGLPHDDLFFEVQLPDGWKKQATDHSMWSDLLDDKDRIRGNIFYKAAFYDRNAHMNLCRYINYTQVYEHHDDYIEGVIQFVANNADGETIFKTVPIMVSGKSEEYWKAQDRGREEMINWLNKHYPNWENVMSYWN